MSCKTLVKRFWSHLQAVHELYDVTEGPPWSKEEAQLSRLVIIGRSLDRSLLERTLLQACGLGGPG